MPDDNRRVLTVEEMAEALGIGLSTAYEMVNTGTVRARQIARKWLIPKAALEEYLQGRDNPVRVLSVDEVAAVLGVHRDTVSKMIHSGTIKALQIGRTWKVPSQSLDEYLHGADNAEKGAVSYEDILEDALKSDDGWFWVPDEFKENKRRIKQHKEYIYYGIEVNNFYERASGKPFVPVLILNKNEKFVSDGYAYHNNFGVEQLELALHLAKSKAGSKAFLDDID